MHFPFLYLCSLKPFCAANTRLFYIHSVYGNERKEPGLVGKIWDKHECREKENYICVLLWLGVTLLSDFPTVLKSSNPQESNGLLVNIDYIAPRCSSILSR